MRRAKDRRTAVLQLKSVMQKVHAELVQLTEQPLDNDQEDVIPALNVATAQTAVAIVKMLEVLPYCGNRQREDD